tara:strand:+ start:2071 stop:2700 length:630 start_codon:yes stop_codon:yes gene_type:complete
MGLKKLSDFYFIRASGTPASTTDTSSTATTLIDTNLDTLRREVLAIYTVEFASNTSDDASLSAVALTSLVNVIGSNDRDGIRYGTRMCLYKNDRTGFTSLTIGDPDVIAVDGTEYEAFGYDVAIGGVGDGIGLNVVEDSLRYPQQYDAIVTETPIAYVTASQMSFNVQNFIDGQTISGGYGGVTGSVRIMARRMEADAALYAAILTGNQ